MKDHYELKNLRKNPYAERMKNGYAVNINYNNGDEINVEEIISLAKEPGIKSITLNFKNRDKVVDDYVPAK